MQIAITRLKLKNIFKIPRFMWHTYRSISQLRKSEGVKYHALKTENHLTYWTVTAWADRDSMLEFRNNGAHKEAMKISTKIAKEAKAVTLEAEEIPSWQEAQELLSKKPNRR
jgi:heme-degrading monooxygenase HmoA